MKILYRANYILHPLSKIELQTTNFYYLEGLLQYSLNNLHKTGETVIIS